MLLQLVLGTSQGRIHFVSYVHYSLAHQLRANEFNCSKSISIFDRMTTVSEHQRNPNDPVRQIIR